MTLSEHQNVVAFLKLLTKMVFKLFNFIAIFCVKLFNNLFFYEYKFSLFIITTGKRVFQTGRVLASISAQYSMSTQCLMWNRHLPHFSLLHSDSFALLYGYKDQSLLEMSNFTSYCMKRRTLKLSNNLCE